MLTTDRIRLNKFFVFFSLHCSLSVFVLALAISFILLLLRPPLRPFNSQFPINSIPPLLPSPLSLPSPSSPRHCRYHRYRRRRRHRRRSHHCSLPLPPLPHRHHPFPGEYPIVEAVPGVVAGHVLVPRGARNRGFGHLRPPRLSHLRPLRPLLGDDSRRPLRLSPRNGRRPRQGNVQTVSGNFENCF